MDEEIRELRKKIKEEENSISSRMVFSEKTLEKKEHKRRIDPEVNSFSNEEKVDINTKNKEEGFMTPEEVMEVLRNPTKNQRGQILKQKEKPKEREKAVNVSQMYDDEPVFEVFPVLMSAITIGVILMVGYFVLSSVSEALATSNNIGANVTSENSMAQTMSSALNIRSPLLIIALTISIFVIFKAFIFRRW